MGIIKRLVSDNSAISSRLPLIDDRISRNFLRYIGKLSCRERLPKNFQGESWCRSILFLGLKRKKNEFIMRTYYDGNDNWTFFSQFFLCASRIMCKIMYFQCCTILFSEFFSIVTILLVLKITRNERLRINSRHYFWEQRFGGVRSTRIDWKN